MFPRLQIPMHDPLPVRLVQGICNLNGNLKSLVEWECALLQSLCQRLPVEILHDQKVDAVLLTDIEDWADVWMAEPRDRLRLSLEPLLEIRVIGHMLGQDLDGDGAVQAGVTGFVDLAL